MFTSLDGHQMSGDRSTFGAGTGSDAEFGPEVGLEFGPMLRMLRTDKGYRLREFAREVGISPAYLSQIERGEARPPREERVRTIALALGQDPELLMAHSGRVSALLCQAIRNSPEDVTRLIHLTMSMDQDQVAALVEIARKLVKSRS